MREEIWFIVGSLALSGCGFSITPKEITFMNEKGETAATTYSCGSYMRVSTEGWSGSTYEVIWTDVDGLFHDAHGVKAVAVSDIPTKIDAPMWAFQSAPVPGARYSDKPDGTPGDLIKDGDIVVQGESQARLHNGKWYPIRIPNPACAVGKRD